MVKKSFNDTISLMHTALAPILTAVAFEYRMANDTLDFSRYVFDLSLDPDSTWLSQSDRDFNRFFRAMLIAPHIVAASMTISWNDGFRATIPMPKTENAPDIRNIGDLIATIGRVMRELPTFAQMKPEDNAMLKLVDRVHSAPASMAVEVPA